MDPYMSVIIPAYNEEEFLGRLLDSLKIAEERLFNETGEKVEIIVVNNASTDETEAVASSYEGVKVVYEQIHNISKVRNTGFQFSHGEVVIFSDADNIVSENSLIEIYKAMKTNQYIGGGMKFEWDKKGFFYYFISRGATILSRLFGLTGVMIYTHRKHFIDLGGFNESFYCGEDILFVRLLKSLSKHKKLKYKNLFKSKVITSARRFNKMTFKDFIHFIIILSKPSLMTIQNNCKVWYSLKKR